MTPKRLRVGLNLPTWPDRLGRFAPWKEMRQLARQAERAGVDTLWVPDHLLRHAGGSVVGFRECWTTLAALAEATERIEIGPFVANTAFRQPTLLAKMAATLDDASGGRLVLALGSGDPARDASFAAFGYPTDHPVGRFEEAVEIVVRLLRDGALDYEGQFHRAAGAALVPPVERPGGPPIWIAAKSPRTFAIAARWADVVNLNGFLSEPATVAASFGPAVEACKAIGRDPATLAWSGYALVSFAPPTPSAGSTRAYAIRGSSDEIAGRLHELHASGVAHLTCYVDPGHSTSPLPALEAEALDRFVGVLEALRRLEDRSAAAPA